MCWWIIQWWDGKTWIKVDATSTGRGADNLIRKYRKKDKGRYRVVNPYGKVLGHCGTDKP